MVGLFLRRRFLPWAAESPNCHGGKSGLSCAVPIRRNTARGQYIADCLLALVGGVSDGGRTLLGGVGVVGVYVSEDHGLIFDIKPDSGAVVQLVLSSAVFGSLVGKELEVTLHPMAGGVVRERAGGQAFPCRNYRVALYGEYINPPFSGIGCAEDDVVLDAA